MKHFLVTNKDIDIPEKAAIYSRFLKNPDEFEILMGEQILLKKVVDHTKKKIAEYGYGYFADVSGNRDGVRDSITFCNHIKKHIFTDHIGKERNSPSKAIVMPKIKPISEKKLKPIVGPSKNSNAMPKTNLAENVIQSEHGEHNNMLSNTDLLRSMLINKTIEFTKNKLTAADSQPLNLHCTAVLENIEKISAKISRSENDITAVCSCYCGINVRVKFSTNQKRDGGYWKPWNFHRHILSHIQKENEPPNEVEGKHKKN